MSLPQNHRATYFLLLLLLCAALWALFDGRWSIAFTSLLTLALSLIPLIFERRTNIQLPATFVAAVAVFAFATLFLGEVGDFYGRFWWWDIAMHSGSAVSFGMIGTILVLILLRGNKLNASAFLVSVFAFCFAVSIGTLWEIFEFFMDQSFGLNMQKSGLVDTMYDLLVDCVGAFIGALVGFTYIKGKEDGILHKIIAEFVRNNKKLFRRRRR